MSATTKRRPPAALPREPLITQADLDAAFARGKVEQRVHDAKGEQQTARSAVEMGVRALRNGAGSGASDTPTWLKISGSLAALTAACIVILGFVWNVAITPLNQRLALLETGRTEAIGLLTTIANRTQAVEAKIGQTETQLATATRIRDQQQQAMTDRMRGLELSDQAGSQQISALAQSLAGLVARMEEMLRRQERLENRLSLPVPRQGVDEAPAVFLPGPRHIASAE